MELPTTHAEQLAASLVARTAEYIRREQLFLPRQPLLLAVSGGVDSVVLCELLHQLGYPFSIAHVNYHLRGAESDRDEAFVRTLGTRYHADVHVHHADTYAYAKAKGQSVQEAAREIRYHWFDALQRAVTVGDAPSTGASLKPVVPVLCTAHHLDDNIETVLLHFLRGTGLAGLRGMLPATARVVRPMLFARRAEVEAFARQAGLSWVEDSSNQEVLYRRNVLRHELIPEISKHFPNWPGSMEDHIRRFRDMEQFVDAAVKEKLHALCVHRNDEIHLPVNRLKKAAGVETILFYFLRDAGFTAAQVHEAMRLLDADSGRQVQSSSHRLLRHHEWLVLAPRQTAQPHMIYIDSLPARVETGNGVLELSLVNGQPSASALEEANTYFLDVRDIELPLLARPWKKGDYFYPLGMRKKKKLARVFIDAKMSATDKEKQWVLTAQDRILLVPGVRIDDRFRITPSTSQVLQVRLLSADR
jgi:tRNA(Ile)-lysidine synthase